MAPSVCPHCGRPVGPGDAFCATCGIPLASAVPPPPGTPLSPFVDSGPWGGAPGFGRPLFGPDSPTPASRAADLRALSNVQWASIVALAGVFLYLVTLLAGNLPTFLTIAVGSATTVSLNVGALDFLIVTAGAGSILTLVELVLYRGAFRALAPIDDRFITPGMLVLLLFIAVVLALAISGGMVGLLLQGIACAGAGNPIPLGCLNVPALLGLLALLAIVGVIALIGYVGLLVGIWRLGTRYGETLFQVGAVLLIIPFLNFIGVILILVGARLGLARLGTPSVPGSFG